MSAGTPLTPAQATALEEWKASRPTAPKTKRPKYGPPDDGAVLFLVFGLAMVSFIVGVLMMNDAGVRRDESLMLISLGVMFGGPIAIVVGGIILYFVFGLIGHIFYDRQYDAEMRKTGWSEYDADLERWKLIADQDFGELAKTNLEAHFALNWQVYNGDLRWDPDGAELDKLVKKRAKPLVTDDPELDALEWKLDNATPGFRHGIKLPPARQFRRKAKYLASEKQKDLAAGKRFLAQVGLPATRMLSPNSAGWFGSVPTSDEELAAVRAEVEPYFTAQGLKVVKFWIGFTGMSVGSGGNYQSLRLMTRVE